MWELLPAGKDGWQVEAPEEVAKDLDKKAAAKIKAADKKAADKGKNVDKAQSEETTGEGDPAEDAAGEGDPDADETNL